MGWVWKERDSWRGAYRDERDRQHTKSFKRQIDAKRWVSMEEAKIVRGDWVDPTAGKVTFAAFYAGWVPRQVWVSSTRENADLATASVCLFATSHCAPFGAHTSRHALNR